MTDGIRTRRRRQQRHITVVKLSAKSEHIAIASYNVDLFSVQFLFHACDQYYIHAGSDCAIVCCLFFDPAHMSPFLLFGWAHEHDQ